MFRHVRFLTLAVVAALASATHALPQTSASASASVLEMKPCHLENFTGEARCGVFRVPENRAKPNGRILPLKVVVVLAAHPHPEKGPVFFFAGGPGQPATPFAGELAGYWEHEEHDLVLIDVRGSGEGTVLQCELPGNDAHLDSYFEPIYSASVARACRKELETHADLTQYSTFAAIHDVDDIRAALGYDKINIEGGSYGTYFALMYIREHAEHVRAAYLYSLAAPENKLPLHHAEAAQQALDALFKQCEADTVCRKAYPHFREDFAAVAARLRAHPVTVTVSHPATHTPAKITYSYTAFADGVRVMLYDGGRGFPYLIDRAKKGDFAPLAQLSLEASRGFYKNIPLGLQLSVACSEFANRIRPEEIPPVTRNTFLGELRVKGQLEACAEWPAYAVPAEAFAPFTANVPTLLVSGATDPVTRPEWSRDYQRRLPNSVHYVIPGGHTPSNLCTDGIAKQLFDRGTLKDLDTSCVEHIAPPAFKLPN